MTTDTRAAAFAGIKPNAPRLQQAVLGVLASHPGGLTADEIAARLSESVLAVRPRVTELHQTARILDTGLRRANQSGRTAAVWVSR